jgi:hypothetical protein
MASGGCCRSARRGPCRPCGCLVSLRVQFAIGGGADRPSRKWDSLANFELKASPSAVEQRQVIPPDDPRGRHGVPNRLSLDCRKRVALANGPVAEPNLEQAGSAVYLDPFDPLTNKRLESRTDLRAGGSRGARKHPLVAVPESPTVVEHHPAPVRQDARALTATSLCFSETELRYRAGVDRRDHLGQTLADEHSRHRLRIIVSIHRCRPIPAVFRKNTSVPPAAPARAGGRSAGYRRRLAARSGSSRQGQELYRWLPGARRPVIGVAFVPEGGGAGGTAGSPASAIPATGCRRASTTRPIAWMR